MCAKPNVNAALLHTMAEAQKLLVARFGEITLDQLVPTRPPGLAQPL